MGCGKSRPQEGAAHAPASAGPVPAAQALDPEETAYLERGVVLGPKLLHEDGYVDMREGTLKAAPASRVLIFNISSDHPRYRADALRRESERAKGLTHPAVLTVHNSWEDGEGFHVVEELPGGKVLLEELMHNWASFSERDVVFVISKVLDGISYLHSKGVSHRELNVGTVYVNRGEGCEGGGTVKLVDYALCSLREQEDAASLRKAEYPPYHYAPEAIVDEYVERPDEDFFAADSWAVGVMTYALMSGNPPIRSEDRRELVKKLRGGEIAWSEDVWARCPQAKEFVGGMLTVDVHQRATPDALSKHPWLCQASERSAESLNIGESLGKYRARTRQRRLKHVVRGMTAAARMAKGLGVPAAGRGGGTAALFAALEEVGDGGGEAPPTTA